MNNLSFEITTPKDMLNKLILEVGDYEKQLTSSRHAINAAMTAWHLVEWIYFEFDFKTNFPKISDFKREIKLKCPKLQIMHDITNGSKHFQITNYPPKVTETKLHEGAFSDDFSRDYDISRLQVVYNNKTFDFINEIENVRDFWVEYFKNELNVNVEII